MPNANKWEAAWVSQGDVLTTQLNALATGSACALGSVELVNSTNLDQYFMAVFTSGGSWTPGSGAPFMELVAVPSADGSTYANNFVTGASPIVPPEQVVGAFSLPASTAGTHVAPTRIFTLGPGKYRFFQRSQAGASLPASGNTVRIYSTNDELQ